MTWQDNFAKGKEIIPATCKNDVPNANIVIYPGFVDDKLLVADCEMKITFNNLKENKNICIVGRYFRIHGKAQLYTFGKHFDTCVKENPDYQACKPNYYEVFNLDNVCRINHSN